MPRALKFRPVDWRSREAVREERFLTHAGKHLSTHRAETTRPELWQVLVDKKKLVHALATEYKVYVQSVQRDSDVVPPMLPCYREMQRHGLTCIALRGL